MKITINTKEDSREEIKKVIKMLAHLVGEESWVSNDYESSDKVSSEMSAEQSASMFDMFNSDDKKNQEDTTEESEGKEAESNEEKIEMKLY